ncbi:(d)CMP kinase [Lactiplantibacillus fabifermentans]|uniref:Cytidylate kinase n=2 Tax=Lactiplantibacillus fabifermentans TaxID=483011 RepID=A0A0R2NCZ5_9LACO|nr:(d)CMP kinase [Lactiplantibacillus fabifermentans]ETY74238.1 cytidylate kinase [Lactiplantibacillus fabifermentans T30PCM01]KRO23716.1 cytidylate kinase (ck) [Lactiplantibacillus fabifermentans DSM 21115]
MAEQALQVAIDGPASAGKSTVAKLVAKRFGYIYVDTGAMYRAVTYWAMHHQVELTDEAAVADLMQTLTISFKPGEPDQLVFANDEEITMAIRQPDVTNNVSTIAALPKVREILTDQQREIAQRGGIVMDGRDIGTTVLPDAEVKIFLVASAAERAKRRYAENIKKGIDTPLAQLQAEIELRDHKDSTRKVSPLTQAADAILVDTTPMSIEQVVDTIADIIKKQSSTI